jgi:hypothetical protein
VFGMVNFRPYRKATLAERLSVAQHHAVDADELISRSEVTAMLFTFADINVKVERIVQLLEDDYGEEEAPQDGS